MCGIAGIFGSNDTQTTWNMLDSMIHRGPDDGHMVSGPRYVLGARRLSIIDLAGGRQPLANEDETIWAAQNGELYNYPEMRTRLVARGHRLRTTCDTEMLPHLYEEHGTDLARRLDGMFAVCLWDQKQQVGLLARDRMGKKPLYYHQAGDVLYFASEIKALLRVPGFERRLNLEALHHYLALKHVPQPLTIFEGIHALPPAHSLIYRPGRGLQLQRYWQLDFSPRSEAATASEDEVVERLLELLRRGVQRRLMADVPIGFFLSGGIDSSLSTALAAEMCPGRIKTFTLTYAGESTTEGKEQDRFWARWVADKYQTDHHEETIAFADFPSSLRRILSCFDEPFAGVVSTYFLAQLISKHVKVAVSGDGADELFGSYLSHRLALPLANYAAYRTNGDPALITPFEKQTDLLARLAGDEDWVWRSKLLVYNEEQQIALYHQDVLKQMSRFSTPAYLRNTFRRLTARDPLNRILEAEFLTIFPDQVLTFVDRLSMAHSLEVRTAFLDTEVVEFVAGLPGRMKMKGGQTKHLLKQAALKYFPPEMVQRKKEGFLMPITQWLLQDLQEYVRDTLSAGRLNEHGLFNGDRVSQLVDEMYTSPCDYMHVNRVYALLVFQQWYDLYFRQTLGRQAAAPVNSGNSVIDSDPIGKPTSEQRAA
jgi:asparagine synthase (glutamine-hydrolysing)